MVQRFGCLNDNQLVFEYKKKHQDDIESEIIYRYQKNSKKLAAIIFNKFKFLYQVEFDDIYCILLGSLFTAIRSFDDDKSDFYQYWKTTATHEALIYINKFTQTKNDLVNGTGGYNEEAVMSGFMREKSSLLKDDYLSSFELDDIFENPKNEFKKKDVDMFRLYLGGYSASDIAHMTNSTYNNVRYRIARIKKKIANILFNQ